MALAGELLHSRPPCCLRTASPPGQERFGILVLARLPDASFQCGGRYSCIDRTHICMMGMRWCRLTRPWGRDGAVPSSPAGNQQAPAATPAAPMPPAVHEAMPPLPPMPPVPTGQQPQYAYATMPAVAYPPPPPPQEAAKLAEPAQIPPVVWMGLGALLAVTLVKVQEIMSRPGGIQGVRTRSMGILRNAEPVMCFLFTVCLTPPQGHCSHWGWPDVHVFVH